MFSDVSVRQRARTSHYSIFCYNFVVSSTLFHLLCKLSTIPSFVRSRLSFSFLFSRTHTPSFLVFSLSPRINPCQPSLITHCIMINQTRRPILACAAPFSPPRLRCLISLPHPRCLTLAALSSLPYPRCMACIVVAPTSHLRTTLSTLLTLVNRPLQVLLPTPTSSTPSLLKAFLLLFASCLPHCLLAEQVTPPHTKHYPCSQL